MRATISGGIRTGTALAGWVVVIPEAYQLLLATSSDRERLVVRSDRPRGGAPAYALSARGCGISRSGPLESPYARRPRLGSRRPNGEQGGAGMTTEPDEPDDCAKLREYTRGGSPGLVDRSLYSSGMDDAGRRQWGAAARCRRQALPAHHVQGPATAIRPGEHGVARLRQEAHLEGPAVPRSQMGRVA